jgi:thiol-disulfide isomerase/thioredoxin
VIRVDSLLWSFRKGQGLYDMSCIRCSAWLVLFLLVVAAPVRGEVPRDGIAWETDLLKARARAVETGRPLLIVFGADWCTFCQQMERTTLSEKEMVKRINQEFVPVHLDFDKQRAVADALRIKAIPCSIVLSTNADVLARHDGFAKSEPYRKSLEEGLKAHRIKLASAQADPLP